MTQSGFKTVKIVVFFDKFYTPGFLRPGSYIYFFLTANRNVIRTIYVQGNYISFPDWFDKIRNLFLKADGNSF